MELQFSEKEEQLRGEVRDFLENNIPEEARGASFGDRNDSQFEAAKEFNRKLAERGWIAPAWPKEYGGLSASIFEQVVFNEEFGYYGAPDTGTQPDVGSEPDMGSSARPPSSGLTTDEDGCSVVRGMPGDHRGGATSWWMLAGMILLLRRSRRHQHRLRGERENVTFFRV